VSRIVHNGTALFAGSASVNCWQLPGVNKNAFLTFFFAIVTINFSKRHNSFYEKNEEE
jgi:hypothetical protein